MKRLLIMALLTGTAAAQAEAPKPGWMEYKPPYAEASSDLSHPHRTIDEVAIWSQEMAANALSLTPADYKAKLEEFKKYFAPQGWQLYDAYLKDSKLMNRVVEGKYSAATIVSSDPEIVNHGAVEGVYHWIVKSPVTISFFTNGHARTATPDASESAILYIDVARTAESDGNDGLAISHWRVDALAQQP